MKLRRVIAVFSVVVCAILSLHTVAGAQKIDSYSPTEYDFGDLELEACETQVFTFQLADSGPIDLLGVSLVIDTHSVYPPRPYTGDSFLITDMSHGPGEVESGSSFYFEVSFCPTTTGYHEAYLRVESDESSIPPLSDIRIPLTGHGIPSSTNTAEFKLSGVEIVKGIDIGDVRYGTMFMGKTYEGADKVGYWWTVIRHTDTENIEVCGGTNNLLKVKLVVVLNDGTLAGNRMVLGLQEPGIVDDVVWDAMAPLCGPACYDDSCICPNHPDEIKPWDCDLPIPVGYGPVATIENLNLKEKFGSTLRIEDAFLSGWLCHNWAFIPRVAATLNVVLAD